MTDRINGFWVALERDIRVDDAEATLAAVRQIKGVLAVEQNVTSHTDWIADQRARQEWLNKIYELLK